MTTNSAAPMPNEPMDMANSGKRMDDSSRERRKVRRAPAVR